MIRIAIKKRLNGQIEPINLDIDVRIQPGNIIALYGDSGAGKTSILRMIAGLMQPDSGKIETFGKTWFSKTNKMDIKIQERELGFVFQDYSLFPNMTVEENLAFAQADKGNANELNETLELIEMKDLRNTYPDRLSGGQKQRVALARTLLSKSKIVLLDEAFSSLDDTIKNKLLKQLSNTFKELNTTVIFTSHDIAEIFALADIVCHLKDGKIIKKAPPSEVFLPKSKTDNIIQQIGIVVSLKEKWKASVLVSNNVIELELKEEEFLNLEIGQKVILSTSGHKLESIKG